jgi:hypothetical protein
MTSELKVAKVKETFSLLFVLNNSNLRLVTITIFPYFGLLAVTSPEAK